MIVSAKLPDVALAAHSKKPGRAAPQTLPCLDLKISSRSTRGTLAMKARQHVNSTKLAFRFAASSSSRETGTMATWPFHSRFGHRREPDGLIVPTAPEASQPINTSSAGPEHGLRVTAGYPAGVLAARQWG